MSSHEMDQIILSSMLAVTIGCFATISGWLIVNDPKKHIPFQNRLRSRIFRVPQETLIESNRKHGVARIAVGVLILVGGLLQIMGSVLL